MYVPTILMVIDPVNESVRSRMRKKTLNNVKKVAGTQAGAIVFSKAIAEDTGRQYIDPDEVLDLINNGALDTAINKVVDSTIATNPIHVRHLLWHPFVEEA